MRDSTEDIYQKNVNRVIDYISAHLHEPLSLDRIAGVIHVSQRQLLRIMRTALDEPLSAYVARQRIERSVMYMQIENLTLTALAEKAGYDNPQSFSKAFKKHFGISPKTYMSELQSRLSACVKGSSSAQNHLPLEVVDEKELSLAYIRIIGKYGETDPYEKAWNKLTCFLQNNRMLSEETRFIGLSFDDPNITVPNQCRFYACASVAKPVIPTGEFGALKIPPGRYAVYLLRGSYSGLQEFYNRMCVDFPYRIRHGVTFEEYLNSPNDTIEDDLLTKIFIPIK